MANNGPPNAPTKPVISQITSTSIFVTFADGSINGGVINERQIGVSHTTHVVDGDLFQSDRSTAIAGLLPGTHYYVWARTHNVLGYSPWSVAAEVTTYRVPDPPSPVILTNPTQQGVTFSYTDGASDGGTPITEREIAYGNNPSTPESFVTYSGVIVWTGLLPGRTYYFWGRVRNSVGWSPYSQVRSIRTIAGARFNIGGTWKEAIPYVNVDGVWKLAQPWIRDTGVWKESI